MIIGIGIDLIEISRVGNACNNEHFFLRCFSKKEQDTIKNNHAKMAGNWAVKEAVAKAFGTGICGFELRDIEVLRKKSGAPEVILHKNALKLSEQLNVIKIHVSITNTKDYAAAYVVLEGSSENEIIS